MEFKCCYNILFLFQGNGMIEFDEFMAFLKKSYKKPDEVKSDLKKAFQVFDLNGDGFISREELQNVLTKMGEKLTDKEVDEMMKKADKNGDGKIDYDGKHFFCEINRNFRLF